MLDRLQKLAGLTKPSAALGMAAAVLAPLAAHLAGDTQAQFLALLPTALARSIRLQLPTTAAYASLDHYVTQVACQENVRRDAAIVHIALVLSVLASQLPSQLRTALDPDLQPLLRS